MQRNAIEPILGALVLVAAAAFLFFAYERAGTRGDGGYTLSARFSAVNGLQPGNDVRISGVKVGQVADITLDPKTYLAMVELNIDPRIQVPTDSVAAISSDGLLGGKYLGLIPGASDDMLKPGQRIGNTQAGASLEDLVGKFIYSSQGGGQGSKGGQQGAQPAPAGGAPQGGGEATHP